MGAPTVSMLALIYLGYMYVQCSSQLQHAPGHAGSTPKSLQKTHLRVLSATRAGTAQASRMR